jgi:hypothetical protein
MKTNKISDVEFIEKYNDGLSHSDLSAHFCISSTTVQKYVKRLKLPKRETIDGIDRERFTTMWNAGCSLSEIGRKFGLCGTTIARLARQMGVEERALKRATTKVSVTSERKPASVLPTLAKPEPEEKTRNIIRRFVVPPTLRQLERQNQQAEVAKTERDYKIYKR